MYPVCMRILDRTVSQGFLEHMRQTMPEMPDATLARLQQQYGLNELSAKALLGLHDTQISAGIQYFEEAAQHGHAQSIANWYSTCSFTLSNADSSTIGSCMSFIR